MLTSPAAALCLLLCHAGAETVLTASNSADTVGCLQHIHSLQLQNDPVLFGLHPNAAIACNKQEGRRLLEDVASLQRCSAAVLPTAAPPATAAAGGAALGPASIAGQSAAATAGAAAVAKAPVVIPLEVQMAGVIKQLLAQLPQPLDRGEASILHDPCAVLPCGRMNPMGVVLLQEMDRFVRP